MKKNCLTKVSNYHKQFIHAFNSYDTAYRHHFPKLFWTLFIKYGLFNAHVYF